jgi:hypothetical protein
MSQAQLAEQMDMEAISLVRLIDSLQEAGLIQRRMHAHDRRIRTLWLTEAARPILAQVRAVAAEVRAQAFGELSDAEREKLLGLLMTVRGNLAARAAWCGDAEVRATDAGAAPVASPPAVVARTEAGTASHHVGGRGGAPGR